MRVIDPKSRDERVLSDTIREMLKKELRQPLDSANVIDCITMLPFQTLIYHDKIYGRWIVTNQHFDTIRASTKTTFSGANFMVVEPTFEIAAARAVHYHYHTRMKE
jgi:hypothetical protein